MRGRQAASTIGPFEAVSISSYRSQHQAAVVLGIARQTLRLRFRDLGLFAPRPAEAEGDLGQDLPAHVPGGNHTFRRDSRHG